MSYGLNSLKGSYRGLYRRLLQAITADTRSLDNGSNVSGVEHIVKDGLGLRACWGKGFKVQGIGSRV